MEAIYVEWPAKRAADVLDYGLDWSPHLAAGDSISSSTWGVSPSGLTLSNTSIVGQTTRVWVAGGAAGTLYRVSNTVVTTNARTMVVVALLLIPE